MFGLVIKIFIYLILLINEYKTKNFLAIDSLNYYFETVDVVPIIFFQCLYFIIERGLYLLLILLILFYLSPNHCIITDEIYSHSYSFIFQENPNQYYSLIILFSQFFVLLYYFEILELNFLGLNKNTKKNIEMREKIEIDGRNSVVSEIELMDQYVLKDNQRKSKDSDDENDGDGEVEKEDLLVNKKAINVS